MTYNAASSQFAVEVLMSASDEAIPAVVGRQMIQVLQQAQDILANAAVASYMLQVLEQAQDTLSPAETTQLMLQVLEQAQVELKPSDVAQLMLEVLTWSGSVTTPAIFPSLIGLGFSVIKRPVFYNAQAKSSTGYTVRIGYSTAPTWEWDLLWDYLPDSTSTSDLKTLLGFYLAQQGSLTPFCFQDPDDYQVTGQLIGTGDGTTTNFVLVRTYGNASAGATGTENIGYLNNAATFNVYLNGTLLSPSGNYTVGQTQGYNQSITFATAPGSGVAITVDMSYYYWVHFKDDELEFEKFLYQLWQQNKITLESLKG